MEQLKSYEKYKESGVAWLGDVPEHWEMKPGLSIFKEKQVKNLGLVEKRVLSLSYGKIIIKPIEKLRGLVPESFETYQIVEPGDIIIRSTDMQNDHTSLRTGLVKDKGIITSAYICLNSLQNDFSNYNHWLLHGLDLMKVFYGLGSGLRQNLSWGDFKRLPLPVPTVEERQQIARYLDWQSAKINKFIKNKKKLIALLKEQKQNIINEAVTKGIDPTVKMKESGVEWLGEIPEHWEVRKLRNILKPVSERNRPDLQLLSVTRERGVIVRNIDNYEENHNFIPDDLTNYKVVKKGQFAMNKMKAWQGSYGVSAFDGIVSPAYFIFNLIYNIVPDFFHLAIRSKVYVPFFKNASDGVRIGQWDLNTNRMKEIPFFIPSEEDQYLIVEQVAKETELIEETISKAEKEITLIQEYRTRLVSDVVTGKLDVRSIEIPDFETIVEDVDLSEDDEDSEDVDDLAGDEE